MPRKGTAKAGKVSTTVGGLKVTAIVNWFRQAPIVAAEVALDLATEAVGERQKTQAKALNKLVHAAGKSAVAADAVAGAETGAGDAAPRKKPGPPKGFRKKKGTEAAAGGEVTGAELPPQTPVGDLPLQDEAMAGEPVNVG